MTRGGCSKDLYPIIRLFFFLIPVSCVRCFVRCIYQFEERDISIFMKIDAQAQCVVVSCRLLLSTQL